ncbi:MAG: flagellar hook-associated protein FlgK [Sulfitobacter sp.]
MTINGAISNALSGLRAASRGTELVSANIANAMTPGYARRTLALSAVNASLHGGVTIDGITRIADESLLADRRTADAAYQGQSLLTTFHSLLEGLMGTPDSPSAISARLSGFENSLITAASRPDAPERLSAAAASASDLAAALNDASAGIQKSRSEADWQIAAQVTQLNDALSQIETLNSQITSSKISGQDTASLMDQRQMVTDTIGAIVPIHIAPRANGQIAIYTEGGAILVDGTAAEIGFSRTNLVTPYMKIEDGNLSGLTLNGKPIATDADRGPLQGGSLGALFTIRDTLGPAAQVELDVVARDLIDRFQDPAIDPSLAPGDAGLFTDDGAAFAPADELGLAARISLNAAVDPAQGGEAWRIRDGVNAAAAGDVGDASLINALASALRSPRTPASGSYAGFPYSALDLVATLTSEFGATRSNSEQRLSFASARLNELTEMQLAEGVDTDTELQNLIVLEQAYAANARVIQVAQEMMDIITRI